MQEDGSQEGLDTIFSVCRVSDDPEEDMWLEAKHVEETER